jgi:putative flippase GtrA
MALFGLIKRLFEDKRIRFVFVGGINTAVGFGFNVLFLALGMRVEVAQTLATVLGVINSYFWNKYFTFKSPKKSFAEIVRFVSVYLVSYLASLGINVLLYYHFGVNKYLSAFLCIFVTTLVSYFGHNFFSFKQAKKSETPDNN